MSKKRRERDRRPARRPAGKSKDPKRRILVVCEGAVTEPQYIKGFERWCRNSVVEVEIADKHGVPLTLVNIAKVEKDRAAKRAKREKDDNLCYDEVWCAFDVDEHPKLNEARQLAEAHDIELAISNPCSELWLWLHFREQPGAQGRDDIQRLLRDPLPGYDKHLDFSMLQAGYTNAVARARRLDEDAERMDEAGRNPSTGFYRLTESIRGT